MKLLQVGSNSKTVKSDSLGEYLTGILYLAPADTVPGINACPMAKTAGCRDACLYSAGRGAFSNVQKARIAKTEWLRDDPIGFVDQIKKDILEGTRKAEKLGSRFVVRLNGTSDIPWEHYAGSNGLTLMQEFPRVQFYDYTKLPTRKVPGNYHLTVSYSGASPAYAAKVIASDRNVSVVFSGALPTTWQGRQVIDGDKTDLRFLDAGRVIVGLKAKGAAKKDKSGFVVQIN